MLRTEFLLPPFGTRLQGAFRSGSEEQTNRKKEEVMAANTMTTTNDAGRCPTPRKLTKEQEGTADLVEIFGEPFSTYTRQQAIDDGFLVDVSDMAREAGFRVPVAMTRTAWADCVEWSEADSKRQTYQDEAGRLWDVLWMTWLAARRAREDGVVRVGLYRVPRGGRGVRPRMAFLKAVIGPGDACEPVITIMLPDED
jgi:hypothetical protein